MERNGHSGVAAVSQPQPEKQTVAAARSVWTPEIWVMLRPSAGYKLLLHQPEAAKWSSFRRPLFVAFLAGCMFSLVASRQLTMRQVADGTINGSFLLVGQIVALALTRRGSYISFSRAIDLFFAGFGPWLVWMLGISTVWAFMPPIRALVWAGGKPAILTSVCLVMMWSGYIDFQFFRQVLGRTPGRAAWDLLQHRLIAWAIFLFIFGAGSLAPGAEEIFGK
jgi:hypothetical protein